MHGTTSVVIWDKMLQKYITIFTVLKYQCIYIYICKQALTSCVSSNLKVLKSCFETEWLFCMLHSGAFWYQVRCMDDPKYWVESVLQGLFEGTIPTLVGINHCSSQDSSTDKILQSYSSKIMPVIADLLSTSLVCSFWQLCMKCTFRQSYTNPKSPWFRVFHEQLTVFQPVQKFPRMKSRDWHYHKRPLMCLGFWWLNLVSLRCRIIQDRSVAKVTGCELDGRG